MPDVEQVRRCVIAAVEEFNRSRAGEEALPAAPETQLIGRDGRLDSLGLVSLIVEVEEQVERELGVSLTLADDKAFSRKRSPFASLESLTGYVAELLQAAEHG